MNKKIYKGINKLSCKKIYSPILETIKQNIENPYMQFHIPGHTRGAGIYPDLKDVIEKYGIKIDCTDEFNSIGTLHPASGSIKKAQELAAIAFGAKKSFFLLNGSTIGNIALALTLIKPNDNVLIARNCHRSVVTGIILADANPIWITPEKIEDLSIWGQITLKSVENTLKNNNVKLLWLTSPTYEGVVSDIKEISKVCKKYNVILLVDEAHGCLWNFNPDLPTPALKLGADAVVHSIHKTGGSFSQSSILHVSHNSKINTDKLEYNLMLLHTTSPSIYLLSSLDAARANLESDFGKNLIKQALKNSNYIRNELKDISNIKILTQNDNIKIDPMKIFMKIEGMSGQRVSTILKSEYNIEIESTTDYGFLLLSNIGNTTDEIKYFINAIKKIALSSYIDITSKENTKIMPFLNPRMIKRPKDAFYSDSIELPKEKCIGRISSEIIAKCPPGIFILTPGELITHEHLDYLDDYKTLRVINI